MDWKQYLFDMAPLLTLGAYTFGVCYFFYRLNEKSIEKSEKRFEEANIKSESRAEKTIKEWRDEHKQQLEKTESRFMQTVKANEAHWREMFMYMSKRIDESKEIKEIKPN